MALQLGSSHSSWVLLPAALLLLLLTASPSGGGAEAGAAHRDGGPRPPYELLVRPARRPSDDPASRRGEAGLLLLLRPPSTPASGDVPQGNASEVLGGRSPSGGGRRSPPGPASCRGEAGLRPSSGGPRWAGRRPAEGGEEYLLQEEEEEQQEEVPAPAGPATSILEGRLHRSSIRHRKSRRNFVRTRKSPKAPPRSRSRGGDGAPARGFEASSWELLLQEERESDNRNVAKEEEEEEEDGFAGAATPTSFPWSSSGAPNLENKFRATGDLVPTGEANARQGEEEEEEEGGGGGEEEEEEEEEEGASSSADPRRHEGAEADVDVVTKFLRIVESQHLMGENCTKGTDFNLGEGVVDRYAQERFRLEGEIAVNRANLYTRLWKYSAAQVLASEYLLHAEVLTMVELDEDIFAAGNCYDKYEYEDYLLFCPFAYRLPEGTILVKDLAVEYKYLSNTSEWFFIARKNAERAIKNHTHLTKGYHTYKWNSTAHTARVQEEILSVTYEDGRWSKPYFDCGGGNIWMMTYTVPFFGYANGSYYFKGTSGIDIDLRRVDIDQCPLPPGSTALNIFANSHKCKKRTTKCVTIPGLGFRRGSYRCECRVGFYFPNTEASDKYYNGSVIEEEYEKKIVGEFSTYDERGSFECLPCAEGCETCLDASPCVVSLNWVMRTAILTLSIIIILSLPVIVVFTWKYGNIKVVRAASPALLRIIILGAFFIYSTTLVLYPIPTMVTCSLRVWLREIGFSLAYGALMLKTWRISVIFRVRSAKAVKITDLDLTKRLGVIVGVFAVFLAIRTVVAPPQVIVSMTADDLKAFLCSTDWWDHAFTAMEMVFLVWGIRLCIMVRKAPSEFNESRFISMAIYNEFLLSLFLNVSMLFLQSPANPDLLFIIFFCHTQLTITLLIALIFGSKAYLVVKGQGKGEESMSMTKPMAAKFLQRPQAANSHNLVHSSSSDHADMQEEFRRLYMQLESLRERNLRLGNRQMVAKITAMKEAANNLPTSRSPATAAPPLTAVVVTERCLGSTAEQQQQQQQLQQQQQQQLQQRRPSRRDRKYSDGIVMKPYVNNILANMTDKIVCATFQEELQAPPPSVGVPQEARGKAPSLRNSVSNEENLGRKGGGGGVGEKGAEDAALLRKSDSKGESFDRGKGEVGVPERAGFGKPFEGTEEGGPSARAGEDPPRLPKASPPGDYVGCNSSDASGNSKLCRSSSSRNNSSSSSSRSSTITSSSSSSSSRRRRRSDDAASGRAPKDLRPPGHRSAEFLLRRSASTEVSERFCRSLERLDEGAPGCGGPSGGGPRGLGEPDGDQGAEDRSVRSAHSTPRRSRGRRFREVRDPERARAFILHSLSGRAELTDEVTV